MSVPELKNGDFELGGDGLITLPILDGTKYQYNATVDLKKFYTELHDALIENKKTKFTDMLGESKEKKKGNFLDYQRSLAEVENNKEGTRTGDMFENQFVWAKNGDFVEFEMNWEAKAKSKHSPYGWYELTINLVCRRLIDQEILIGNEKKKLQQGTWEFRNKLFYKNKVYNKYLQTIPFVKNSPKLQQLYIDHIYYNQIMADFKEGIEKILPIVTSVMEKHFRPS